MGSSICPEGSADGLVQQRRDDWLVSGGARVLVDEAVEPLLTYHHAAIWDRLGLGRAEAQGAMWPGPVVMVEVLAQDLDQVALAQDDQPVQTLSSQGAQYPLAGGVRTRAAKRGSGDPDASGREDRVGSRSCTSSPCRGSTP